MSQEPWFVRCIPFFTNVTHRHYSPCTMRTMHQILHFLHHHPLQEIKNNTSEYLCDGCITPGISTRYRCNICDFDLHECCATSTPTLASFLHPQHDLTLVVRASKNTRQNSRMCDLCGDQVEGLFYRCKICDFDIHPVCNQLPEYIRHGAHLIHPLRFQGGPAGWCNICYDVCTSWRYRCGLCGVNIHLECILAPPTPLPPPPPPFYGGYGVPAAGNGVYNSSHQYANAYQHASSSSGAVASKGKSNVGKKVGLFVGKVAMSMIASGVLGIPDVSSFFS